ncbi:carbamoyl-phosphate synthase large subunit [Bacillus coahuilensis m2-6]|uniref:Carbamoyl-phosphate synthase large subunit n=1 Tax=Bacillus coahuilensis p1.1.43 TaxID=1150625 RepID=A0A147K620_9BACI|nr:ATP-grasp domain-containing protein [Bacillus coahuilensis]KUP05319.1 carbamoyl-phosphate synthase large subunit [Bacillus coahuilensis p1.1.43]KUP06224.1 carbamoyl-phosphate synthase large subunit [Bacillus coahuilensis m2-6]
MNIWFNRWFSTVSHYIELLRDNPDKRELTIYGSHPNPDAVYLKFCDVSEVEPHLHGAEYIEYCLSFCERNQIDVFIPRKENVLISKSLSRFHELGVKVLVCPDHELMDVFDNKEKTYKAFEQSSLIEKGLIKIPEYRIVRTVEEFQHAYEELSSKGLSLCFKPIIGEGASGFRVISKNIPTVEELLTKGINHRIPYQHAIEILKQNKEFEPLMVIEYLDGPEYSIDCLGDSSTLYVAVPRKKGDGRIRELLSNPKLLELAKEFQQEFQLPYIYNIQVKYKGDEPYLLEINPRMSGGLHSSCYSGINYPYLALKLLLEEDIYVPTPIYGLKFSHLEKDIAL